MTLLLLAVALWLAYLVLERVRLDRRLTAVPLRITVTGTRGKSSVTRMLASVLRQNGARVLAKTTGSQALMVLPDGSEKEVRRRGHPSILEQKGVIHLGAETGVDAAVIEIMSLHPENHLVESHVLLKPHIVVVTNFRVDHTAAMGETREEVASVLALDVPRGARVFVPEGELIPSFRAAVMEAGGELVPVRAGAGERSGMAGFEENLDLVFAVAGSLGIDERTVGEGIRRARGDVGALAVWRYRLAGAEPGCFVVNAFAANDPESTGLVHRGVLDALGLDATPCVGLLSLRPDRGDRTVQWTEALAGGFLESFDHLYVCGLHARALKRGLRRWGGVERIGILRETRAPEIMRTVLGRFGNGPAILFGFGNIGGVGESLVKHWSEVGERVGPVGLTPLAWGEPDRQELGS